MTSPDQKYCVVCGEAIPDRRLRAIPGTTTCEGCSSMPRKSRSDLRGEHFIQHTDGLHEKYLHEEDAEMDRKHDSDAEGES